MLKNRFGIYVHIPYCLQRCSYCDFATYEHTKILPPEDYFSILNLEILQCQSLFQNQGPVDSLYFGGGTPSLVDPLLLQRLIENLANLGFPLSKNSEVTIEINPATINEKKLNQYLKMGINRFSVGAQSFNDNLLMSVNREHNSAQTRETLQLLKDHATSFSFDILFALPQQTLDMLKKDLDEVLIFNPQHISPYCLTVPEAHPLSKARLPEEDQVKMFELIQNFLESNNYTQYEISNFSKKNFESQHNLLYWTDQNYWGIGLSAHSYQKSPNWGSRFWNHSNIIKYKDQIQSRPQASSPILNIPEILDSNQFEILTENQSLTDFCHTSLRLLSGLNTKKLETKFGTDRLNQVLYRLNPLIQKNLLKQTADQDENLCLSLTQKGILLSNLIFEEVSFLD